jgi:hypothetical protein
VPFDDEEEEYCNFDKKEYMNFNDGENNFKKLKMKHPTY